MFIRILFLSLCAATSFTVVPYAVGDDTTVALTATVYAEAGKPERDLMDALLALLEPEVSTQPGLFVVERQQIDLILHELALSRDLGRNSESRLRLAQIASADLILTLELKKPEEKNDSPRVLIRIVESLTGIIRGASVATVSDARVDEAASQIAQYLALVEAEPERPPITVAVAPFECKGRFEHLRPLERTLRDMVVTRLRKWSETLAENEGDGKDGRQGFRVLQRSSMKQLLAELELIQSGLVDQDRLPSTLPTRAAAFLVRGSFNEKYEKNGRRIIVSGRLIHAASNKVVRDFTFETKSEELNVAFAHQVDLFAGRLLSSTDEVSPAPGKLREVHEVDSLFEKTLTDIRRFRRQRPIDFSYRDFALKGKTSGPPIISAESVLGQAVLKKSIDHLETVLFLQPENMQAAYALAYCLAFHVDGIWQPKRADALLRKVGAAAEDSLLRAESLKLLAEISFHHRKARCAPKDRALAVEQIVHGLTNVPKEHRDYIWARMPELFWGNISHTKDKQVLENLLQFSQAQAAIKESRHRSRFTSVASMAARSLKRLDPNSPARVSMEDLLEGEDLILKEGAARGLGSQARQAKDYVKAALIYQKAATALASSDNKSHVMKADNLRFHAARCLREGGHFDKARALLESFQSVNPKSLNAGYCAVELGQCYMHFGEIEKARDLLVNAAEECDSITHNSNIEKLIEQLGGAPLREDRDIDVEYIKGPGGIPMVGKMTANESTLFIAGSRGIYSFDTKTQNWHDMAADCPAATNLKVHGNRLWVATAGGLWYCDLVTEQWSSITTKDGLPDKRISAITFAGDTIYAGVGVHSAGGVVRIDMDFNVTVLDEENAPTGVAHSLAAFGDRLLAATYPVIHELNLKTGEWTKTPGYINVFPGKRGIWSSKPRRELVPYGADNKTAEQYKPIWFTAGGKASYGVSCVLEDGDNIWLGGGPWKPFASSGFYRFDRRTGDFNIYGPRDGFRSSGSYRVNGGTMIDDVIWLATSDGLAKVTPRL